MHSNIIIIVVGEFENLESEIVIFLPKNSPLTLFFFFFLINDYKLLVLSILI